MKVTFDFANSVIVLPRDAVEENLRSASREELCVLLSAAAKPDMTAKERAKELGISEREVSHAIAFWRGAGVISSAKTAKSREGKADAKPPRRSTLPIDHTVPRYSAEELAGAVIRPEFHGLIDHCQQLMGKILNASEVEKVIGICNYLTVSPEFVALLCSHLKEEGKLNLRLLEKSAMDLHDRGICDFDSLSEHIDLREKCRSIEGKIRTLFGMGRRSLTPAEKRYIETWTKVPFEMVEYAYELTVNATGDAPMKYTNSIIENWIAKGYASLDDAKKAEEEFQKNKKPRSGRGAKQTAESSVSSFATDDFFEAAMRRSYGDAETGKK